MQSYTIVMCWSSRQADWLAALQQGQVKRRWPRLQKPPGQEHGGNLSAVPSSGHSVLPGGAVSLVASGSQRVEGAERLGARGVASQGASGCKRPAVPVFYSKLSAGPRTDCGASSSRRRCLALRIVAARCRWVSNVAIDEARPSVPSGRPRKGGVPRFKWNVG